MIADDRIMQLRQIYPRRDGGQGWSMVPRLLHAYTHADDWDAILIGTKNYAIHCGRKVMVCTEYVMQAKTFYGRDKHWQEWSEMDLRSPAQIESDNQWADLEARARALGFQTVDRSKGITIARYAIEAAERDGRLRVVR